MAKVNRIFRNKIKMALKWGHPFKMKGKIWWVQSSPYSVSFYIKNETTTIRVSDHWTNPPEPEFRAWSSSVMSHDGNKDKIEGMPYLQFKEDNWFPLHFPGKRVFWNLEMAAEKEAMEKAMAELEKDEAEASRLFQKREINKVREIKTPKFK